MEKKTDTLIIRFDGSCYPNPGGTPKFGWTISDDNDNTIKEHNAKVENFTYASNNVAEWSGLLDALSWLKSQNWNGKLIIQGDSKLVIEQFKGNFSCNKEYLKLLRDQCRLIAKDISSDCDIQWIPREENKKCDALSKM